MDKLDKLVHHLASEVERVCTANDEIAASSNRVLAELLNIQQSRLTAETLHTYRENAENMLNSMIASSATEKSDAEVNKHFSPTHPSKISQQFDSIVDFQSCVQRKSQQIKKTEMMVAIINETVEREICKND